MGRLLGTAYGTIVYVLFLGTFLYAIGFVGNWVVPKSIDSGEAGPLVTALVLAVGLYARPVAAVPVLLAAAVGAQVLGSPAAGPSVAKKDSS